MRRPLMTDDRTTAPAAAPPRHATLHTVLLLGMSVLIGVTIVELFCHLFYQPVSNTWVIYKHIHEILFFDGPTPVVRNVGEIFTYQPNSNIRNLTGFFSEDDFNVEYDYKFTTNNFGLVQDTDITPERDSLLLLGDSFTEG